MDELWIETTFGRLYARTAGEKSSPLVLAVHGFSQRNSWQSWEPLMQPLAAAGYYVVSLDMPGWGQSTVSTFDPLEATDGLGVLEAVLDKLGHERAQAVMGKSWGGAVALTLALDKPERVAKLILTAPAFMDFARLATLTQPVLLAWATDDTTIPVSMAANYQTAVPDLQLVIYEKGGHSAAPKNAGDFASRAIAFLNQPSVEKQL